MRVAVVGGGIIGLAVAWRLHRGGADVTVHDDGTTGAWHVAAGMLGAGGEAAFERRELGALMAESARRWPAFAAGLSAETGVDCAYEEAGTVGVALTADDVAEARRGWRRQGLTPAAPRELEPELTPRVRGGAFNPADRQVDPRRVVRALRTAVPRIVPGRVTDLDTLDADTVVVAAGCGTAALTGLPIRPVKGQLIRLRGEPGVLRHVVDAYADGLHVYLVPRADGEIVLGATQEERTDATITAGAVHDLLRAALALFPVLAEFEVTETLAGFRPGTPDNAPVIGRLDERTVVAAGHFRNGVLLTPVTADLVTELVLTGAADPLLAPFSPRRFT